MKPDGILFSKGMIKGLDFPIYLDLLEPKQEINFNEMIQKAEVIQKIRPPPNPVGRVNYKIHNYCARCKIKYPKGTYRCKNCNGKCRTKPWASNYNRKKNPK